MKRTLWIAFVAVGLAQVGCGGKSDPSVAGGSSASGQQSNQIAEGTGAPPPPPVTPNQAPAAGSLDAMVPLSSLNLTNPTKPEEVVGAFLDGMRTGNAAVIANLLSTRARKEIADKGLDIAPIGSPQAKFEIGVAQVADPNDPNTVLVSSNWLEPGVANGQPASEYEVVWALVRESAGWRICEMAVDTHQEGEEIQVVNFENLSDVVPAGNAPAANAPPTSNPAGNVPRTAANPGGPALPPANFPASNFPASNPPAAGGLPALPGAPGGGPGSLPPLPPAGLGAGNSGQSGIR
jgi:hypothetical protein